MVKRFRTGAVQDSYKHSVALPLHSPLQKKRHGAACVCYALCLCDCCTGSFIGAGRAALCCTDEETNEMVQKVCDIIVESNASVLHS